MALNFNLSFIENRKYAVAEKIWGTIFYWSLTQSNLKMALQIDRGREIYMEQKSRRYMGLGVPRHQWGGSTLS